MSFRYSINSTVSLSSAALSISSGKRRCSNRYGVIFRCAVWRYASIASWVLDLLCAYLLRRLWSGASSSVSFFKLWGTSWGDHLGVTGCSTLGGGTTLGVAVVGYIFGVGSDSHLGCWEESWGVCNMSGIGNSDLNFFVSVTYTLLVCIGGAIGGVRCWWSFCVHTCLIMVPSLYNCFNSVSLTWLTMRPFISAANLPYVYMTQSSGITTGLVMYLCLWKTVAEIKGRMVNHLSETELK